MWSVQRQPPVLCLLTLHTSSPGPASCQHWTICCTLSQPCCCLTLPLLLNLEVHWSFSFQNVKFKNIFFWKEKKKFQAFPKILWKKFSFLQEDSVLHQFIMMNCSIISPVYNLSVERERLCSLTNQILPGLSLCDSLPRHYYHSSWLLTNISSLSLRINC